jgi:hypothetical protein
MKRYLAILGLSASMGLLAGCTTTPGTGNSPIQSRPFDDPSGPDPVSHVRIVHDPAQTHGCVFVKAISAMGMWGGKPRDLQAQAVALGANTVFIGTDPYTMGARLHGEAYKCPAPAATPTPR